MLFRSYLLEHGYCTSLYATDPNGLILEMTVDNPAAEPGALDRKDNAHAELKRWLNGHYQSNNTFRTALHSA